MTDYSQRNMTGSIIGIFAYKTVEINEVDGR
jgi:hypothetical protein